MSRHQASIYQLYHTINLGSFKVDRFIWRYQPSSINMGYYLSTISYHITSYRIFPDRVSCCQRFPLGDFVASGPALWQAGKPLQVAFGKPGVTHVQISLHRAYCMYVCTHIYISLCVCVVKIVYVVLYINQYVIVVYIQDITICNKKNGSN